MMEYVGSSPSRPQAKRQRRPDRNDLPPEIWARICSWLPQESVRCCAATSRAALEGMALVKTIHIDHPLELHAIVPARHPGATDIIIDSLFVQDEDPEGITVMIMNDEIVMRALPILTRFPKLQRVSFPRPLPCRRQFVDRFYIPDNEQETLQSFIDSIAAAFRCGVFSDHVKVLGLFCPKSYDFYEGMPHQGVSHCRTCTNAIRSFPLKSVVEMEYRGSSLSKYMSRRPHQLDICLTRRQGESFVEQQPRGREMLRSPERLLHLLGTGSRFTLVSDDNNVLHIVKFTTEEVAEIKRFIHNAQINARELPSEVVTYALMRSFAKDERDPIPPKKLCYLAHESFRCLKNEIGLQIEESYFYHSTRSMVEFLPSIASALIETRKDTDKIYVDCARLLRFLLESEGSHIIDRIFATGIIQSYSESEFGTASVYMVHYELTQVIKIVATSGSEGHMKMLLELDAINIISNLLHSPPSEEATVYGIHVLYNFFIKNHVEKVIKPEKGQFRTLIHSLTRLLEWSDDTVSDLAIRCLGQILFSIPEESKKYLPNQEILMASVLEKTKHHSSNIGILRISSKILVEGCTVWPKKAPNLTTLSKLLLRDDGEVLENVCAALGIVLAEAITDPAMKSRIRSEIEPSMCNYLMGCLSNPLVQERAAGTLYLIIQLGSFSLQSVVEEDLDLSCICTLLSSTKKSTAKHACAIISSTLRCARSHPTISIEHQIQAVIVAFPSLIQMMEGDSDVQMGALMAIEVVASEGTFAQIKGMVSCGCVSALCDTVTGVDIANVEKALAILKRMLDVGRHESSNVQDMELILAAIESELEGIFKENKAIDLLEKKRIWMLFDLERERVRPLLSNCKNLKKRKKELQRQIEADAAQGNSEETMRDALANLDRINDALTDATAMYNRGKASLKKLLLRAEEMAPKDMWHDRLIEADLPDTLEGVELALNDAQLGIIATMQIRAAIYETDDREAATAVFVSQLEGLFN